MLGIFSGPPAHRPRIRVGVLGSTRVIVHIRRVGEPMEKGGDLVDFEAFTKGSLQVAIHRGGEAKQGVYRPIVGRAR